MAQPENRESLIARAEEDYLAAEILRREDDELTTVICFHLQQYAEKMIKARLNEIGIEYPTRHNIMTLLAMFPESNMAEELFEEATALTDYATSSRYNSVVPSVEQMNKAFTQAERIVEAVKKYKP
ncbi:MAG: HEPN domain-containing protein [archaeon]|nr:HEPN domain-containing protein [archaeon]